MKSTITKPEFSQPVGDTAVYLFDDWFDPIEAQVRERVRGFIHAMIEGELDETLQRPRYGRRAKSSDGENGSVIAVSGHRHGHRTRSLTGTFGTTDIKVPRARLTGPDGKTTEWKSKVLRTYQRRTLTADALIASAYLSGTNTRRVRRALKTSACDEGNCRHLMGQPRPSTYHYKLSCASTSPRTVFKPLNELRTHRLASRFAGTQFIGCRMRSRN